MSADELAVSGSFLILQAKLNPLGILDSGSQRGLAYDFDLGLEPYTA